MENDLELGIATMFSDAAMQSVVPELRKPEDWDRFNEVIDTAKKDEQDEVDSFRDDKEQRRTDARKDLIDKAGSLTFEHPTPFSTDSFDKSAINRQVEIKVENDHQAALLGIVERRTEGFAGLKQDIHVREGVRDHARDAFARTNELGNGEEHGMPTRDR